MASILDRLTNPLDTDFWAQNPALLEALLQGANPKFSRPPLSGLGNFGDEHVPAGTGYADLYEAVFTPPSWAPGPPTQFIPNSPQNRFQLSPEQLRRRQGGGPV